MQSVFRTRQISRMELFDLTVFTKKSIIDFQLGSKYASVMEFRIAFSKIPNISQKITILKYIYSKVVGLKEKCNSYFCVTSKNCLMKIIKRHCHKKK